MEPEEIVSCLEGVACILSLMQDACESGADDVRMGEALGLLSDAAARLAGEVAKAASQGQ